MQIRIWHGKQHDDATTTEMEVKDLHQFVQQAHIYGGFFKGTQEENNFEFIPWHRVNYIEQVQEEA